MAEPTVTFGTTTVFGTQTGWVPQGKTVAVTSQRASVLDGTGNEEASALYDETTTYSQEFKAAAASAPTIPDTIGALVGSAILTGISISTSATDFVTMTLTGHQHSDNAHADTLRQAEHGFTLTAGFGAEDFLDGTAGDNADVESSSIEITVQHSDVNASDGDHLVGENYNGMVTASTTWNGAPTTGVGGTWDETEASTGEGNTEHVKTTYSGTKSFDVSAPA